MAIVCVMLSLLPYLHLRPRAAAHDLLSYCVSIDLWRFGPLLLLLLLPMTTQAPGLASPRALSHTRNFEAALSEHATMVSCAVSAWWPSQIVWGLQLVHEATWFMGGGGSLALIRSLDRTLALVFALLSCSHTWPGLVRTRLAPSQTTAPQMQSCVRCNKSYGLCITSKPPLVDDSLDLGRKDGHSLHIHDASCRLLQTTAASR